VRTIETNPINDDIRAIREAIDHTVDLNDPQLVRVTRLRLVSDPGFPMWDLSYCYGELKGGVPVRVRLPWHQFSRRYLKRDLVLMCKEAHVYAKGLGLLDESVISTLL
jgi:hypothetical protein